jgi:hypothetical protein
LFLRTVVVSVHKIRDKVHRATEKNGKKDDF